MKELEATRRDLTGIGMRNGAPGKPVVSGCGIVDEVALRGDTSATSLHNACTPELNGRLPSAAADASAVAIVAPVASVHHAIQESHLYGRLLLRYFRLQLLFVLQASKMV